MLYRKFFEGSAKVSSIGMGGWQLGVNSGWSGMSDSEAQYLIQAALESGINFFDTAPNYGNGTSEERLGKALKGTDRASVVINSKFGHMANGVTNYNADSIRSSVEGSLQRLQTDHIDSLLFHSPPATYLNGNQNPHYEILERLKEEGKIRAYGASLDSYDEIKLLIDTTGSQVIEVLFNILHQDAARAFEEASKKGVGIIVKIPLDSGWLSGKYFANSSFKGIRSRWNAADIANRAKLVHQVKTILGDNFSLPIAAIAFCLAFEAVSTVIPGSLNTHQLSQNLQAINFPLPQETVEKLMDFYRDEVVPLAIPW